LPLRPASLHSQRTDTHRAAKGLIATADQAKTTAIKASNIALEECP
jgi:hypothetical protein